MAHPGTAAQAAAFAAEADRNGVMLQAFHWDTPRDGPGGVGGLWRQLVGAAGGLAAAGFTSLWLPPAVKGFTGSRDVGYGVYDLYDLGEFDQCRTVRTKYGTKDELLAAVAAAHATGLRVYADIVLNHRLGADAAQHVRATPFADADRTLQAGRPRKIRAHTKFLCPGRAGAYSAFVWNAHAFSSVDYDGLRGKERPPRIYLIDGHTFRRGCRRSGAITTTCSAPMWIPPSRPSPPS
eukprot:TRINITY_DN9078_c0_g1_i1.p2 TRINITY_DN9078_c0_g1~~TRINITY_DN9078_c0_g1_i1.p2  ORF type:complete len:237 (-),score=76.02 TRINITY_DN9078_c0_g1_i1:27-737(-)